MTDPTKPVVYLRNLTDPQPHAVTDLRFRSAADADAGVQYLPVYASQVGIGAAIHWVQARLDSFIAAHGATEPDTGALTFGRGTNAEAKTEYVGELEEIIEGLLAVSRGEPQLSHLEQFDLEHSAEFFKGWTAGRLKGYEVGQRHAMERTPPAAKIEAAAKVLASAFDYPWEHMPEQGRENIRKHVRAVLKAAGVGGSQ